MDEIEKRDEYYLYMDGEYKVFKNVPDLGRLFGFRKEIREFAKENNTDFKDHGSLEKLVAYAYSLKK